MKQIVVGYARVSTREQAEDSNALKQQIARLENAGIDDIYRDVDSGANPERKEFKELVKAVERGEISTVIATRWDRLTREQTAYAVIKELLREHKVKLILLDQGQVDLSTASGELNADLQALFAIHERRQLRERIQWGHEHRRSNDTAWTRAPWAYFIEKNNKGVDKYVLDKRPVVCVLAERPENYLELCNFSNISTPLPGISKAEIAREAIDYFLKTRKPRQVLAFLYEKYGVERKRHTNLVLSPELLFWSAAQNFADEWLGNPILRGHTSYCKTDKSSSSKRATKKKPEEWELHPNTHPNDRLITDEEFVEIQAILQSNAKKHANPGKGCYLTGLVICDRCGYKCVLKSSPNSKYYGCRQSGISRQNRSCIRLEKIDQAIISQLFLRATSWVSVQEQQEVPFQCPPEVIKLREQLEGVKKLLEITPSAALQQARTELLKQIEEKSAPEGVESFVMTTAKEIISHPQAKKLTFWYTLTQDERDILYEKLIERVKVDEGKVISVELKI
jgi:DNA invertase Pin-like site-specific DNA recombinase